MVELLPQTALGGPTPQRDSIGALLIAEVADIALASISARQSHKAACTKIFASMTGNELPNTERTVIGDPFSAFWMAPDQWMLCAPFETHEDLASVAKKEFGNHASVTEQTDAWAIFDLSGSPVVDVLERLCPAPVRRMTVGHVQRTTIDHLGCFVICLEAHAKVRVLGPRSAAGSLHHALMNSARAVA